MEDKATEKEEIRSNEGEERIDRLLRRRRRRRRRRGTFRSYKEQEVMRRNWIRDFEGQEEEK